MERIMLTPISALFVAAMTAGGAFSEVPAMSQPTVCSLQSQDGNFPEEASRLLFEIQTTAWRLTRSTDTLESYSRGGLSWQSHANELNSARTHINAIGERLTRLQTIREAVAPWQQQALDSLFPIAVKLAGRGEAAIRRLSEDRNLVAETYSGHLRAMADHANQMRQAVGIHLELARTQNKLDTLRLKASGVGSQGS